MKCTLLYILSHPIQIFRTPGGDDALAKEVCTWVYYSRVLKTRSAKPTSWNKNQLSHLLDNQLAIARRGMRLPSLPPYTADIMEHKMGFSIYFSNLRKEARVSQSIQWKGGSFNSLPLFYLYWGRGTGGEGSKYNTSKWCHLPSLLVCYMAQQLPTSTLGCP